MAVPCAVVYAPRVTSRLRPPSRAAGTARSWVLLAVLLLALPVLARTFGVTFAAGCCAQAASPAVARPSCCAAHPAGPADDGPSVARDGCGCGCESLCIPGLPDMTPAEQAAPAATARVAVVAVPVAAAPWDDAVRVLVPQAVRPPPLAAPLEPLADSLPRVLRC